MKRALEQYLIEWKNRKEPLPLLLRGARQVGKTYIVEQFAKKYFPDFLTINFELQPEFKSCFTSLNPEEILKALYLLTQQKVQIGSTLLFFDEIQECPEAIQALRYFKEKMPGLHIIGAGSLLEFILNEEAFRMPVGRVIFLYLKPLSFIEFLSASGAENLCDYLQEIDLQTPVIGAVHERLLKYVKEYCVTGGMPAVVENYVSNHDLSYCQQLQQSLLNAYQHDFGKYASRANYKHLQNLFVKAPQLIAKTFKYTNVDAESKSRDIKQALGRLYDAGLLIPVYHTAASGLPLNAVINEKKFKVLFLDVGLVKRATQLDAEILLREDLLLLNQGMFAEQFVGQELLAYMNPFEAGQLFFWERDKRTSQAEIDFVMQVNADIIPIEVKAGTTGRLKSLQVFMQEQQSLCGVRISQLPLSYEKNILSVPLYLVSEIPRLIQAIRSKHA